jgi:preprotein translocase subunit SecG
MIKNWSQTLSFQASFDKIEGNMWVGGVKTVKSVLMILDGLLSIALIASVVLQSSKSAGMSGAISGGAETIFGGKKKGIDEILGKATMILGGLFAIITLAIVKMS